MNYSAAVKLSLTITIFVLNAVGCVLLSVLVVSVSLSQRLHRRDPVVNNFLYTWILLSGLASFNQLCSLAKRDLGNTTEIQAAVLVLITMVSTLNLSLHLWYIMRSAWHQSSPKARKLRTLATMLVSDSAGLTVVGFFALVITIATPITDAILLVYYWRWYFKTKKANMSGVMSLSFFIRLLAFSLYQLSYTILLILGATSGTFSIWSVAFSILQNIFPILAFCVVGLHKDILQLWFPCFWKREYTRTEQDELRDVPSGEAGMSPDDQDGDSQHLLERGVEEKDHEDVLDLTVTPYRVPSRSHNNPLSIVPQV